MPRRRRRPPIPVTLVLPAEPPAQDEACPERSRRINAITSTMLSASLMAADAIIDRAGRSGLTLILNGSRSKKALEWEWDKLPDYGRLSHLTAGQITRKIDWCIHHRWPRLETINRDIKFMLLDAIRERERRGLAPVLRAWFPHEVRAVRKAINRTLGALGQRPLAHPQPGGDRP